MVYDSIDTDLVIVPPGHNADSLSNSDDFIGKPPVKRPNCRRNCFVQADYQCDVKDLPGLEVRNESKCDVAAWLASQPNDRQRNGANQQGSSRETLTGSLSIDSGSDRKQPDDSPVTVYDGDYDMDSVPECFGGAEAAAFSEASRDNKKATATGTKTAEEAKSWLIESGLSYLTPGSAEAERLQGGVYVTFHLVNKDPAGHECPFSYTEMRSTGSVSEALQGLTPDPYFAHLCDGTWSEVKLPIPEKDPYLIGIKPSPIEQQRSFARSLLQIWASGGLDNTGMVIMVDSREVRVFKSLKAITWPPQGVPYAAKA